MENIIVNGSTVSLATLRQGVAESVKRAYGAERAYAQALNASFAFDWFAVEANDTSTEAKAVHAEKKELFAALKAVEHTNPSTVWARIRKYGKAEKYPQAEGAEGAEAEGAEGEAEGEAEGAGSRNKSPMVRNIDDLLALYKFNMRQDGLPPQVASAQVYIVKALEDLGVDLNLIK
jgi:hypothetical protein